MSKPFIFSNAIRDYAVFPKRPDVDYEGIARDAVNQCLDLMVRIADSERVCVATEQRLRAGTVWFDGRAANDLRYVNGLRTQHKLNNRLDVHLTRIEQGSMELWHACCTLYAALTHVDTRIGTEIIALVGIAVPGHPRDVWDILTGGREPPGHWPLIEQDYYIELT